MPAFYSNLLSEAPGLVGVWGFSVVLFVIVTILYAMQGSQIKQNPRSNQVQGIGVAMTSMGIVLCVATAIWNILHVNLEREVRNIWLDASSIYVSRRNILANWWTTAVTTKTGKPISGITTVPNDDVVCNGTAGFNVTAGPEAYDNYRALYKAYQDGKAVPQTYESATAAGVLYSRDETEETQEKLGFAYYRYLYCTKSYMDDIVNKRNLTQANFPFLPQTVLQNLQLGKSNCGYDKLPDTTACVEGGIPGAGKCAPQNPCFTALAESISAQCLLYDDNVFKRLNPNTPPRGVLAAMELAGDANGEFASQGVPGYQVRAPPPPVK